MKELLPVGSIVLLKGAVKKAAIMGYLQKVSAKDDNPEDDQTAHEEAFEKTAHADASTVYDYMAVPYPEGYLGKGSIFLFNEENISEICFRGYDSDESKGFAQLISMVFDAARKGME